LVALIACVLLSVYRDLIFADSTATAAESDAALTRSNEASDNADDYLLMTLLTATALFFAGVATSSPPDRLDWRSSPSQPRFSRSPRHV
jgi:hypothetical protein